VYLVTGGAGFIGSNIVEALVNAGTRVRVLDNLANGKRENLEAFADRVQWVDGDIRDLDACKRAVSGVSVVLQASRDAGVKRVVFSSSSSVYGENPALPKREDLATFPISPYAVSKLAAESYTKVFSKVYGLETVSLRYFNVFGPRQRADSPYAAVIPLFMQSALEGHPLPVNGERYSLLDIVHTLAAAAGRQLACDHRPPRAGDVRHSQADISAAQQDLGYRVEVGFRDGLALTWRAFLAAQGAGTAS
jgi:nucleoside-diphosphate-sugar epimerase